MSALWVLEASWSLLKEERAGGKGKAYEPGGEPGCLAAPLPSCPYHPTPTR